MVDIYYEAIGIADNGCYCYRGGEMGKGVEEKERGRSFTMESDLFRTSVKERREM